jgi:hypothetical protein
VRAAVGGSEARNGSHGQAARRPSARGSTGTCSDGRVRWYNEAVTTGPGLLVLALLLGGCSPSGGTGNGTSRDGGAEAQSYFDANPDCRVLWEDIGGDDAGRGDGGIGDSGGSASPFHCAPIPAECIDDASCGCIGCAICSVCGQQGQSVICTPSDPPGIWTVTCVFQ